MIDYQFAFVRLYQQKDELLTDHDYGRGGWNWQAGTASGRIAVARERPGRGRVRVGDAACHVAQPVAGRPRAGRRTVAQDAVEPTDLLGLEGIALLDAWAGDHDREFTDARLAEIRRLLDDEKRWLVLGANGTEDVSVVHASS